MRTRFVATIAVVTLAAFGASCGEANPTGGLLFTGTVNGASVRLINALEHPTSGSVVPRALAGPWQRVIEDARTALPRVLDGKLVDLFVSDSLQDPEHVAAELRHVLTRRADDFVLITPYGSFTQLEELTGLEIHRIRERPLNHHYPGNILAIGRRTREGRDRVGTPLGVHAVPSPRAPAQLRDSA